MKVWDIHDLLIGTDNIIEGILKSLTAIEIEAE